MSPWLSQRVNESQYHSKPHINSLYGSSWFFRAFRSFTLEQLDPFDLLKLTVCSDIGATRSIWTIQTIHMWYVVILTLLGSWSWELMGTLGIFGTHLWLNYKGEITQQMIMRQVNCLIMLGYFDIMHLVMDSWTIRLMKSWTFLLIMALRGLRET